MQLLILLKPWISATWTCLYPWKLCWVSFPSRNDFIKSGDLSVLL